jgi:hypothetical protein
MCDLGMQSSDVDRLGNCGLVPIISGDVDDSSVMGEAAPGGQYGGAITYVAEHVSDERRGYYTDGCSRRSEFCCRSSSLSLSAPILATTRSTPGRGASRSCFLSSWC